MRTLVSVLRTCLVAGVGFALAAYVTFQLADPNPRIIDGEVRRVMPIGAVIAAVAVGLVAAVVATVVDLLLQRRRLLGSSPSSSRPPL